MNRENVLKILKQVEKGMLTPEEAITEINDPGFEDLGFARIDHDRAERRGFPEVVLCEGKTREQIVKIMENLAGKNDNILATRAEPEVYKAVKEVLPGCKYNKAGRVIVREKKPAPRRGHIKLICAGTSDLPVLEETYQVATVLGNKVTRITDAGVAGVHRLLNDLEEINQARVVVVVAGMDGALPSVVAGLVKKPVIAVPTSVGYGANFGGLAPLLTMLNSCASGVGVVNIDNGFGAAYLASSINQLGLEELPGSQGE